MAATTAELLQAKLNGPAMAPPPGVTPNFIDPPNLRHIVVLVLTLCMSFSTVAILMRMYTKLFILRKTAFEDCRYQYLPQSSNTDCAQTSSF